VLPTGSVGEGAQVELGQIVNVEVRPETLSPRPAADGRELRKLMTVRIRPGPPPYRPDHHAAHAARRVAEHASLDRDPQQTFGEPSGAACPP
jgi:hypothetical protein